MTISDAQNVPGVPLAGFESSDRQLHRSLSLTQLLFLSLGAIIGSGWLLASLKAAATAGPAAVASWVVGGIFVILIALAWAEPAAMLPRSGAIVRYPHLTHGSFTGWVIGWAYWLSAVSVPTIEAEAVLTYVGGRWPQAHLMTTVAGTKILAWPNGILSAILLLLLFACLNFFGIRLLGEVNRWVTWWKLVIPSLTFCFLFAVFRASNFTSHGGFAPLGIAPVFQALATSGIIFAYLGFRQALDYGGEARNPQRDIPLATIGSVVIAMLIYVLLQVAFTGALNWHAAGVGAGDWSKLASGSWASGPLYGALTASNLAALGAFGTVLLIDAAISPSGTGWIYLGAAVRTNYGLSIDGYFPRLLQRINRFGIPWLALVASFLFACLFLAPAPSWYLLVGFITSTTVVTYLMGGVGLPVLRRHAPGLRRPFRLGWARLWAPAGFLAALMVVYWSGFSTLNTVFAAIMFGLPLYGWYHLQQKGWVSRPGAGLVGLVFLIAWIYINRMGGYTLTATPPAGSWSWPVYAGAFAADVLFYCAALAALSTTEGRRHIASGLWLILLILATFVISYYGEFGPLKHAVLPFPVGTLVEAAVGLVAFYAGVNSGFQTDELKEIVEGRRAEDSLPAGGPNTTIETGGTQSGRHRVKPA